MKKTIASILGVAGLMLLSLSAQAVPVLLNGSNSCSSGNSINGISTGDVTGNAGGSSECYGTFDGNDPGPSGDGFDIGGNIFDFISKLDITDGGGTILDGANIGLSITGAGGSAGTWQYNPALFGASSFLIVLKAANSPGFAAWLFEGADAASSFGAWSVAWTNASGKPPALSHIAIYAGEVQVPEPGTAALFGLGLLLLGFANKKKNGR